MQQVQMACLVQLVLGLLSDIQIFPLLRIPDVVRI
jgi:hypothetical protein